MEETMKIIHLMIVFSLAIFTFIGTILPKRVLAEDDIITIFGQVTDEDRNPVSGVNINFVYLETDYTENIHFVQTDSFGNYSVDLTLKETGIDDNSESIPEGFKLYQNYPNPFNPGTVIKFELPQLDHVKLSVFDIRGQLVKVLTDKTYPQGLSQVQWDGTNRMGNKVSAGVYLYRIETANFTNTKKMLLLDGGGNGQTTGNTVHSQRSTLNKVTTDTDYTFAIYAGRQDFELFFEDGFTVSSNDTAIEKNITLSRSFPEGVDSLKRELRLAKISGIELEIADWQKRLESSVDSALIIPIIDSLQVELQFNANMPDNQFLIPDTIIIIGRHYEAGDFYSLEFLGQMKSGPFYTITGSYIDLSYIPAKSEDYCIALIWTIHRVQRMYRSTLLGCWYIYVSNIMPSDTLIDY